jgi:hypothetical protein
MAAAEEQERRHLDAAHGIAGNITEHTSSALQSRQRRRKALTMTEASRAAVAAQAVKRQASDDAMITAAIDKTNREIIERSAKGLLPPKKDNSGKRAHHSAANVVESKEADLARVLAVFDEDPATTYAQMQACREAVDRHVAHQASLAGLKLSEYHFAGSATNPDNGQPLKYQQLIIGADAAGWSEALSTEWEKLLTGTETAEFIHPSEKPSDRVASYFNPVCSIKDKPEGQQKRVRGTYGGNITDHEGEVTAEVAAMSTIKVMFNAVISEPNSWFSTADIKDFYLNTVLERAEYMWAQLADIPKLIQLKYEVQKYAVNGRVLVKLKKGVYGLPQAGLLARKRLVGHLKTHNYLEDVETAGVFHHITRPIYFTLVVDDFGIKCGVPGREHVQHLHAALREIYEITVDWTGTKYIGYTLKWDYVGTLSDRKVTLSMPNYVSKALARFGVTKEKHDTNSPGPYSPPVYGAQTQKASEPDSSPTLSPQGVTRIQQIVGVFLYYARALDCTMLHKINQLGSRQSQPTEDLEKAAEYFMQYAATWPDVTIVYRASDMVLHAQGDGSYLSETKARSRAAGFIYLGSRQHNKGSLPLINGPVSVFSTILKLVVCSAAEVEYGAGFLTGRELMVLRRTCNTFGYPQPTNDIQTDNECAAGIANDNINQKLSKAMDMRFHWLRDQVRAGLLSVTWRRGADNLADYFTKNHSAKNHLAGRRFFVVDPPSKDPNQNMRTRRAANINKSTSELERVC